MIKVIFEKLLKEKEGDQYATVEDKNGNKLYQFYFKTDGEKYVEDFRFSEHKVVRIESKEKSLKSLNQ